MKKMLGIALMLIVVLSVLPMALAEENETQEVDDDSEDTADTNETATNVTVTDEEDDDEDEQEETEIENETEDMDSTVGARVRLLQLEKAIARNIVHGQEIISEAGNATNVTELKSILAEMEALKAEVQKADPAAENAVQVFVDLKKDAIELSKKFRDKARELLKEERRAELKLKLKEKEEKEESLKKLRERINSEIKAFNAERMVELYKLLGLGDNVIEKIKSGELTAKEALEQMKEKLKAMTPEERKEVYAKLKELRVKEKVAAKAKLEKLKDKQIERKELRLQNRLEAIGKVDKRLENLEEYTKKRLEAVKEIKEREDKGGRR